MTEPVTDPKAAAERIFKNISAWAPPVPAPIDVKSVNWATDRYHANWDGNQGASSRTLASGASATGDPRMVNVRIHEPLNPVHRQSAAAAVSVQQRRSGAGARRQGAVQGRCARRCHTSRNQTIYPASTRWASTPNRTLVNTSVSRYGLAALVMEACRIYGLNNQGQPGAEWCVPEGDWQARARRVLPRHAAAAWRKGPTATRPTCCTASGRRRRICTTGRFRRSASCCARRRARARFLRGNLHYDEALVGFEWADRPAARYGPNDTILIKEYDTDRARQGQHRPHLRRRPVPRYERPRSGHRPEGDRGPPRESRVGALLAYLKTL